VLKGESYFAEKAIHGILTANESPRPYGVSHAVSKTSSTKRAAPDDKLKKRSSQISKELSDMVVLRPGDQIPRFEHDQSQQFGEAAAEDVHVELGEFDSDDGEQFDVQHQLFGRSCV
jgi:hypothetical protein